MAAGTSPSSSSSQPSANAAVEQLLTQIDEMDTLATSAALHPGLFASADQLEEACGIACDEQLSDDLRDLVLLIGQSLPPMSSDLVAQAAWQAGVAALLSETLDEELCVALALPWSWGYRAVAAAAA